MKPIFVETLWSEAGGELDKHQVWAIDDFEKAALETAMAHKTGGYLKTNVNVLFNNGDRIQMRLDLAPHDTHGVKHHVENYRTFLETPRGKEYLDTSTGGARSFLDAMLSIDLTPMQVAA